MKWIVACLSAIAAIVALLLVAVFTARPAADHPFFTAESRTQVIAHRGGSALRPENTLAAFSHAADLGVDILEMDVRLTSDGAIVVIHDATVDRTTDGVGAVEAMPLAKLRELDAGFRFSADGGKTYPYRGANVRIPRLEEVFERFPAMRMNIEMKSTGETLPRLLCALILKHGMSSKVLIASFPAETMVTFRKECPEVATSMTVGEARVFLTLHLVGLGSAYSPSASALQVPYRFGEYPLATPAVIQSAQRRNLKTYVWTINDEARMRELVSAGINGIITDRPDLMLKLMRRSNNK
jgi:glycerophosphoryl diester phosphodiesterase